MHAVVIGVEAGNIVEWVGKKEGLQVRGIVDRVSEVEGAETGRVVGVLQHDGGECGNINRKQWGALDLLLLLLDIPHSRKKLAPLNLVKINVQKEWLY